MQRGTCATKVVLLAVGALVLLVPGWYGVSRLRALGRTTVIERVATVPDGARLSVDTLKIAAYNIAHGRGPVFGASNFDGGSESERRDRLQQIGALLASLGLDIVVLNEVDFSCTWSHGIDEAVLIAEAAGLGYVARQSNYDLALPFFRVWAGNAVLSRYPITGAVIHRFEPYSRFESRFTGNHDSILAAIDLGNDRSLRVWGVHFEFRSEQSRLAAARSIISESADLADLVIAGDFNSTARGFPRYTPVRSQGSAIDLLLGSGLYAVFPSSTLEQSRFTFPSQQPDRTIDWILVSRGMEIVDGAVLPDQLSDHLLVHATVGLNATQVDTEVPSGRPSTPSARPIS